MTNSFKDATASLLAIRLLTIPDAVTVVVGSAGYLSNIMDRLKRIPLKVEEGLHATHSQIRFGTNRILFVSGSEGEGLQGFCANDLLFVVQRHSSFISAEADVVMQNYKAAGVGEIFYD